MIFYLTLFLFFIFMVSYFFNRDILFPANILTLSFFIFSFFAVILMKELQIDIMLKTFYLIIVFVLIFVLSSNALYFIEDGLLTRRYKQEKTIFNKSINFINIPKMKILFVVIIQLVALFVFVFRLKSMLGSINSETLKIFRSVTYYHDPSFNYSIPGWISFLGNISKYLSLFSIFILINNHFSNVKNNKNKFLLILSSLLYIPISLLNSSRYDVVICLFYALFIYIFYLKYLNRNILKSYFYVVIIIFLILLSFGLIGTFIGRASSGNNVVTYAGGSITLFNDYMQFPIHTPHGIKSFEALYKGLYKLHLINQYTPMNDQEFRSINGMQIGNVYTALRSYYGDFGTIGIYIFPLIYGSIFGFIYRKIKSLKIKGVSVTLIYYAFMCWTLILAPYSETFNNTFLSFGFFVNLFILIIIKVYYSYL